MLSWQLDEIATAFLGRQIFEIWGWGGGQTHLCRSWLFCKFLGKLPEWGCPKFSSQKSMIRQYTDNLRIWSNDGLCMWQWFLESLYITLSRTCFWEQEAVLTSQVETYTTPSLVRNMLITAKSYFKNKPENKPTQLLPESLTECSR